MKKIYLLSVIFSLTFVHVSAQRILLDFSPTVNEKDINLDIIIPDSTVVLKINNYVLDSIIRKKITYIKDTFKKTSKVITVVFRVSGGVEYIVITGNVPKWEIVNDANLLGIVYYDCFNIYIYDYMKKKSNKYFIKTDAKHYVPKYDPIIAVTNTPRWFYIITNEDFEETVNY